MKYTNINILDDERRFKYIIEYLDNAADVESSIGYLINYGEERRVDFVDIRLDSLSNVWKGVFRNNNVWKLQSGQGVETKYLPSKYNISSVNLYFPTNSVESFTNNNLYALTVNTWIHGHIVYLGSYLIDRRDALACDKEKKFLNRNYYEYVNVKFIDPWYLTYSDEWKEFRQEVCGEVEGESEQNNTGAELNFTLYPIVASDETESEFIKLDPYIGGQNAINISNNTSDYIGCDIEKCFVDGELAIRATLKFNNSYDQTYEGLVQYMKETYDIDSNIDRMLFLDYDLLIVDDENIYKTVNKKVETNELSCIFTRDDLMFDNWEGFKEGMRLLVNANIYTVSGTVDMGLSVRWARCNLGANTITGSGNFYAWGEVVPNKDYYWWGSYRFGDYYITHRLTKYNTEDDKVILDPEDDAAYVVCGSNYRSPSKDEFSELIDPINTTRKWTTIGDTNGYLLTSKKNGNTIFIPAAGEFVKNEKIGVNRYGNLNSLNRYPGDTYFTYNSYLTFNSSTIHNYDVGRCVGHNIRPVRELGNGDNAEDIDYREDIMLLRSNSLPLTQDLMKYFISIDDVPKYINLDNVDMNNYTINAVNKIEKKIIQVEKPNNNKANIIKPVYYKVYDLASIIIHPAVTENICINLDPYKATTDVFYIQVEGTVFGESARINNGTVFKIIGSNLTGEVGEGTYYILNQDKELITTGKYKYES